MCKTPKGEICIYLLVRLHCSWVKSKVNGVDSGRGRFHGLVLGLAPILRSAPLPRPTASSSLSSSSTSTSLSPSTSSSSWSSLWQTSLSSWSLTLSLCPWSWSLLLSLPTFFWILPGLHKLWQPSCEKMRKWRGNGGRVRKWRENEEMERDSLSAFSQSEWRKGERFTLYISLFSFHFLPLYPFPISKFTQNVKKRHFCRKCHKKITYFMRK